LTVPWLATGAKAGVSMSPCGVLILPVRAAPEEAWAVMMNVFLMG
jgi:hypothetical protein